MANRQYWVDYAKAIGIFLVVYGHVLRGLANAGLPLDNTLYHLVDGVIYSFHMPLFFFISGLFFYSSFTKRGIKSFVSNKIDTIIYAYFIWSIIQGLAEVLLSSYTNSQVNFTDVLSLLWQPRAQFWFLYALFMVFVFASIIFTKISDKYILPVFICSIFIYIFQSNLPSSYNIGFITHNFVFFIFGAFLNKYSDFLNSPKSLTISAVFFIIFQYLFYLKLSDARYLVSIQSLLLALVSILFIIALSKNLAKNPKNWVLFIGSSSMAIYVMHVLFASGTRIVLVNAYNINSTPIHIIAGTVAGLIAPLLIVVFAKKYKFPYLFSAPISQFINNIYNKSASVFKFF